MSAAEQCELPAGRTSWGGLTRAEKAALQLQRVTRVRSPIVMVCVLVGSFITLACTVDDADSPRFVDER